jgi:hypothetical protein
MVYAALTGFTAPCDPTRRLPFEKVFPGTKRPQIALFSGQPRISPDTFNALLASKLSCLRSKLGLNSTPKNAPRLISSWINLVLKDLVTPTKAPSSPKPVQKGKKTTSSSEQKEKKNKVEFTNAATADPAKVELVQPDSSAPSPDVHPTLRNHSVDLTALKLEVLLPDTPDYASHTYSDRLAIAQILLSDHHHRIRNAAALAKFHIIHPDIDIMFNLAYELTLLLGQTTIKTAFFNLKPHKHEVEFSHQSDSDLPPHFITTSLLLGYLDTLSACYSRF